MGEVLGPREKEQNIIENPFEIMDHESFVKQMEDFEKLLDEKDPQRVLEAIKEDPRLLRTAILEKGDNLCHLDSMQEAADILLKERYGLEVNIDNITAKQIKDLSNELGLAPSFWVQLSDSAFHSNNENLFMHLTKQINEAFPDSRVQNIINHNIASWQGSREKIPVLALKTNKKILTDSKESELDPRLKLKILFGINYYKFQSGKKFKEIPEKMINIAQEMEKLEMPEAARAYEEAAKMALEFNDPDQAEDYLKKGIEIAYKSDYSNAVLGLEKTWAEMLKLKGDYQESGKHFFTAINTSQELGGHYKETKQEVSAELRNEFECRVLIELEGMGILVRKNGEKLEFPNISLKIPQETFNDLPNMQKAKELVLVREVEKLLFGDQNKKKKKGKKKDDKKNRSLIAGRKYEKKGKINRDYGEGLEQEIELSRLLIPESVKIFDSTLTRLRESGYNIISREKLEASENLEEESRKLLSL